MYDLAALEAALAGTIFAGKLHFSPLTGSTNTDTLEAARAGAPHGSVFFADAQSAGRGRGDHRWLSDTGQGLYVSVLLRLPLPAARVHLLPLAAGLAAAEAIGAASDLAADLRWPNDLLIGERKAGGILVESKLEADRLVFAVAGIGINVHQRGFASDLATPATSLDLAAGRAVSREALLVALLESLEREAHALLQPTAGSTLPMRVAAASTWVRGRQVKVHGPQACAGVTAGLDEHGFMLVDTTQGRVTVRTGGMRAAKAG
jgi:BirA family transcriptional regulator, biotin operon repressor / biotin---[acetyl-CoA-carboxylase] ligase